MGGFDWLMVSTLIGNIIGWFLKNKTDFVNRAIPYVQIGIAALKNVLVAAGFLPVAATVAGTSVSVLGLEPTGVALAGFGSIAWFVLSTVLDAALPIGLHSLAKNAKQLQDSTAKKAGKTR